MIYVAIGTSLIILSILLMRLIFLKKGNPNFIYFLWFFAFGRMIIPISIPVAARKENGGFFCGMESLDNVLKIIYFGGVSILLLYVIVNNLYFWFYVRTLKEIGKSELGIRIYESKKYNCLFGIISPKIMISSKFCEDDRLNKYVILHEEEHFRIKDNIWRLLRIAGLIIQWYNPLAWVAFFVSEEDCEVACDYRVACRLSKNEKADYTESILSALDNSRRTTAFASNLSIYARMIKKRIKTIFAKKSKKEFIWIYQFIFVITVLSLLRFNVNAEGDGYVEETNVVSVEPAVSEIDTEDGQEEKGPVFRVDSLENAFVNDNFNISSYYCKLRETVANKYWIDDNGVLWGTGNNNYGQIGNGKIFGIGELQEEPYKIAEDVVSVDASVNGCFMVYLTKDGELYGVGSNRLGLLGQPYEIAYSDNDYKKVTEPVLLMQNVSYVSAGMYSIVALKDDGSVWFWGEYKSLYKTYASWGMDGSWSDIEDAGNPNKILINSPTMILENCIYAVTGNWHGAAITKDGELYTWGLNIFGDCGVKIDEDDYIRKPTKVLENVNMVWVEKIDERGVNNEYRIDSHYKNVYNFNIFAILNDGTVLAAGEGIGNEAKTIQVTGDLEEASTHMYSDKFIPIKLEEFPYEKYRNILQDLEWGTSFEEVKEYLTSNNVDYSEGMFSLIEDSEDEYITKELTIEDGSYRLEFDKNRNLCRIYMLNDGSRDGSFLLGMSYEDVSDITGVELVEEQDKSFDSIMYRTSEPFNGIYYGFVFNPETGKLVMIIESLEQDVFAEIIDYVDFFTHLK